MLSAVLLLSASSICGQIRLEGYRQQMIAPELFSEQWTARWISLPDEPADTFGVYHFRKNLELDAVPQSFVVHTSADNRYKLFVNGTLVTLGPARCDTFNWNFETTDIAPYLKPGRNVLAAVVWNYADRKPLAQMSLGQTGFLLQGNGRAERIADTGDSWVCVKNESYSPWDAPVYGYYVCGPGELFDAALYPWGWEQAGYDDSSWKHAAAGLHGVMKGGADYPGRLLVPRPIPTLESLPQRLAIARIVEGGAIPKGFPAERNSFSVAPGTRLRLVLDNGVLTTGYPVLEWSGGRGSRITIGYTEAFYLRQHSMDKGNRNDVEGKIFAGYEDVVVADGGASRSYSPLWWRTWRYLDITIETGAESLLIEDIRYDFSAYPFAQEAVFDAPERPELAEILDIGWRTARLCAHETYMDCPYYEQLQYFGDTRIQAMVTLYNTRDGHMVRSALEHGRRSMTPDGFIMSRWPSDIPQFIPTFSLWWIGMGYDYWMMRGDEEYVRCLLPAYRSVLAWFAQWLKPDGSLDRVPYWYFGDWAKGFERGMPPREEDGGSAFQDLVYLLALDAASRMERELGEPSVADIYDRIAGNIRTGFEERYWDAGRGLYADTYTRGSFSQHVNSMAVLAGIATGNRARDIMHRCLAFEDITETTIYFCYYFNLALKKAGLGDLLLDNLDIWEEQMALGLTTWAEEPEPSRSDCHAWGASPNVELFRTVLGIEPASPGFRTVRIEPFLGSLREVTGEMPHPSGMIRASYSKDKKGVLTAEISLPTGISGEIIWNGSSFPLKEGSQIIRMK